MHLSRIWYFVILFFAIISIERLIAAPSASSSSEQWSDAIIVSDPCPYVWDKLPEKYKNMINVGGVTIDVKTLFMTKCNEYRDELIEEARKPITAIKAQAQDRLSSAIQEAKNTFLSWVAEKFRDRILPTLPADVRDKYDPNSPLIQAKAQAWLNQPGQEISTYVNEYIQQNAPAVGQLIATLMDVTEGESAQIISGMKVILQKAQNRLNQLIAAKQEIEANPDTPYTEILQKHGFSGTWIDKFQQYEGQINAFNAATNMKTIVYTTIDAFQTDDPKVKIEKMFDIMDAISSAASGSKVPILALVGDIVNNMAQVAKKMLKEVNALGEILKKRAGYCVGTGAPGDDVRSRILDKRGILACPLSHDTLPWKHIYETVEPEQGLILFWDGEKFIDGQAEGGSKAGLKQAMQLMSGAKSLGYQVNTSDIASIAAVYNTPGGIPKLMNEAQKVMTELTQQARRLQQAMGTKGKCSSEHIIKQVESMTGLNLDQFLKEIEANGLSRLITTYAASYVAKTGGFGDAGAQRSNAYDRYRNIWEKIKDIQIMIVDGEVRSQQSPQESCIQCAQAHIDAKVTGGVEARGCEVWQADNYGNFVIHIIGTSKTASVSLSAQVKEVQSETITIQLNAGTQAVKLLVPLPKEDEQCPDDFPLHPKISSLAQLNTAIEQHKKGLFDFAECSDLSKKITSSLQELESLQKQVSQGQAALLSCNLTQINEAIEGLSRFNQPLSNDINTKLMGKAEKLKEKEQAIEAAMAEIKQEAYEVALTHLQNAKTMLQQINCPTDYIDELIKKIDGFNKAQKDPNSALTECQLTSINTTLEYIDDKPEYAKLKTDLLQIKEALSLLKPANNAYKSGEIDSAANLLNQARAKLAGFCPEIIKRIDDSLEKIKNLHRIKSRIQQAILECDKSTLEIAYARLTDKANPFLKAMLPSVEKALEDCAKTDALKHCKQIHGEHVIALKTAGTFNCVCQEGYVFSSDSNICIEQKKPSTIEDGHPVCQNKYGEGAYAVKINDDGTFHCQCKTGYIWHGTPMQCVVQKIEHGHPLCQKLYGEGAYASSINPDSTYKCLCKTGYIWHDASNRCVVQTTEHGHPACKQKYGKGSYSVGINQDGTFQCQCSSGYRWNSGQTQCIRITIKDGHQVCRKNYGKGSYAVGINPNGSYQCQCKSGYIWTSGQTYCRRITKQDGHRACKQYYGNQSYAIRYLGNGRWRCYQPQQLTCPTGYYLANDGLCYPYQRPQSDECPPGYHRKPGGPCHAN